MLPFYSVSVVSINSLSFFIACWARQVVSINIAS
uniref:Uncharacterized protein n=1 Tax=Arundo donax TaxID=35708 RepID=A0A0A9G3S8_ARUDO